MKTLKFSLCSACIALVCVLSVIGCSSGEDEGKIEGGGNETFSVSFGGKIYTIADERILVPYVGATYELAIKSSKGVNWTVRTEGVNPADFLEVNTVGSGQGDKTIQVVASANEEKDEGHIGTVIISNSVNDAVVKFVFDQKEKELYIPKELTNDKVPEGCVLNKNYDMEHVAQGPNVAIFYDKRWGASDPKNDRDFPLDLEKCVAYAEDIYKWMIDVGGFTNWTTSCASKKKLLIFVERSNEGGAVGYGKPDVGITEVKRPGIMNVNKYGVPGLLQHEMMHCFQYLTHYDNKATVYGWAGPIYEMTSQWALLKRFPDWPDLEYGHFEAFMKNTHKAFMHEDNQYHSPYVLEFWEYKHPMMVSELWEGNIEKDNQDPVQTYKRLNNLTQEQFIDEMFEGVCRFVTWDIPHLKEANAKHIDKHQYKLKTVSATKFRPDPSTCPQNYGYNCIKLKAPAAGKTVTIDFKGNVNLTGYKVKNGAFRGWRYGFVALKENGERIYGEMNKEESKRITFTVPEGGVKYLWFVVMGAPTEHWKHKKSSDTTDNENNWPYEFSLNGVTLDTPVKL